MYGPASVGSGPSRGPLGGAGLGSSAAGRGPATGERRMTPRGQMSGGANQRPPLADLPPNMKMMFEPRPPIEHKPPVVKRKMPPYSGIGHLVHEFELITPPVVPVELPKDRKLRIREQLLKAHAEKNDLLVSDWDPNRNYKATDNAYHTLFVSRLAYETTEKKLRREFEQYGPIKTVKIVLDNEGKPRGYAFIEFEREEDMTNAYKRADGRKIDGRRIIVDVERGRTVRDWRPRRFGGGLGGRKAKKSKKETAAEEIRASAAKGPSAPSERRPYGGDRGGDRGGRGYGGRGYGGDRGGGGGGGYGDRNDRPSSRPGDRSGLGYNESHYGGGGGGHYGPPSGGGSSYDRKRPRSRSREREETGHSSRGNGSRGYNDDRGRGEPGRGDSGRGEPEGGRYERRRRSRSPDRDRGRY